jgi:hypothetical protein
VSAAARSSRLAGNAWPPRLIAPLTRSLSLTMAATAAGNAATAHQVTSSASASSVAVPITPSKSTNDIRPPGRTYRSRSTRAYQDPWA